jgi:hypothetical protein
VGLDEERSKPVNVGQQKRGLWQRLRQQLQFEFGMGGQPLWLFQP